jgi:hypothetical protein
VTVAGVLLLFSLLSLLLLQLLLLQVSLELGRQPVWCGAAMPTSTTTQAA